MRRRPRPSTESILGRGLWRRCLIVGSLMAATVLAMEVAAEGRDLHWRTMGFTTLAVLQLGHAVSVRAAGRPLRSFLGSNVLLGVAVLGSLVAQTAVLSVPFLRTAFDTEPLTAAEFGVVGGVCLAGFAIGELDRARRGRRARLAPLDDRRRPERT